MDVQAYLNRIDFDDTIALHKNVLFKLQRKHLLNVPFENLDIHYNRKIKLLVPAIYQKIINEKRGGFCYELNGLFHSLLKQIGFDAKLISARVHIKDDDYSPEYDHLAIIVNLENKQFLVDVGFGKFSLEPLTLEMNQTISDSFGKFQFDKFNKEYYRINEVKDNNVLPQYIFKNEERKLSEFTKRCEFHQTSEHSHFTKKKLISIAKTNGRISLNNSQLKITHLENEEEINFDEREFESKLKHYFNIDI